MALTDKLTAIGDAIRQKTGSSELIPLSDMPSQIDEVYKKGAQSEYDAFWDAYQKMGGPQQYVYSFAGYGWDDTTFKPKYDIIMRYSCLGAFQYNEATDIAQALFDCGVTLDTSGASSLQGAFGYSKTKRLPVISAEGAASATGIFEGCTRLERIEKFVLVKKNVLTSAFKNCTKLKDIVFEGEIGYNTDLQYSPLSKDSITSVLGVLSATTSGLTLTLNKAAVEKAFEDTDEWNTLIAAKTNWTITLI
jgi:hypothetical protein